LQHQNRLRHNQICIFIFVIAKVVYQAVHNDSFINRKTLMIGTYNKTRTASTTIYLVDQLAPELLAFRLVLGHQVCLLPNTFYTFHILPRNTDIRFDICDQVNKRQSKAKQKRFTRRCRPKPLCPPNYTEHNLYKLYIINQNY